MNDSVPIPPHLVRATVVATLSDGRRVSWVIEGDPESQITTTVKPQYDEHQSAESLHPLIMPTGYDDLTFELTNVRSYTVDPAQLTAGER